MYIYIYICIYIHIRVCVCVCVCNTYINMCINTYMPSAAHVSLDYQVVVVFAHLHGLVQVFHRPRRLQPRNLARAHDPLARCQRHVTCDECRGILIYLPLHILYKNVLTIRWPGVRVTWPVCVCVCVCVCAWMQASTHACLYVSMHGCIHISVYLYRYIHTYIYIDMDR